MRWRSRSARSRRSRCDPTLGRARAELRMVNIEAASGRRGSSLLSELLICQSSASGSNLTFESRVGFPQRVRCASLRDARWKIAFRFVRRYSSAQSPGSRPQCAAEARLAGGDRAVDRRWRRHERDYAANWQVQDLCLALAGTLYRGGVRRTAPRQDASLAHQTAGRRVRPSASSR